MLNTFCSGMAAPTAPAKAEIIVVNADRLHSKAIRKLLSYDVNYLRSSAVSHGTAIYHKHIHIKTSDVIISIIIAHQVGHVKY